VLTLEKIKHAAQVLEGVARKTPLTPAPTLTDECELYLKCENLQLTGSFKVRGGYYKISQLTDEEKARGVIACSAGNHAQGIALGAQREGIKAVICMPASAPLAKIEATRSYGAEVVLVDGVYDDAAKKAVELQKEKGYTFAHPFNDEDVMAGQGTVGLEIVQQLSDAEVVLVPIGGGGLISGVAFAVKTLNPNCKVYGVQAAGAPSMLTSLEQGKIVELPGVQTFADGIAVKQPGELTYDICSRYLDGIVTVTENEIATAVLALVEKQKIVAEGAGAVSVAAVLHHKVDVKGKKVVCVISGGNIDVNILSRVLNRGLVATGRSVKLTVQVTDKPGNLKNITSLCSEMGANIVSIYHDRTQIAADITSCNVEVVLETVGFEHIEQIKKALNQAGYHTL